MNVSQEMVLITFEELGLLTEAEFEQVWQAFGVVVAARRRRDQEKAARMERMKAVEAEAVIHTDAELEAMNV